MKFQGPPKEGIDDEEKEMLLGRKVTVDIFLQCPCKWVPNYMVYMDEKLVLLDLVDTLLV